MAGSHAQSNSSINNINNIILLFIITTDLQTTVCVNNINCKLKLLMVLILHAGLISWDPPDWAGKVLMNDDHRTGSRFELSGTHGDM